MLDIFKYSKNFSRDINILWLVHRTLRDDFPKVDVKGINYDFGRRSGRSERIAGGQSPKARSRLFLLRRLKNFVGSIRTSSFAFEKKRERKKNRAFFFSVQNPPRAKKDSFQKWGKVEHKFKIDFRAGIFFSTCDSHFVKVEAKKLKIWSAVVEMITSNWFGGVIFNGLLESNDQGCL